MHIVRRDHDVVMANRTTMLNAELSPTSRLLYVTLLASLDTDVPDSEVAALAGLSGEEAMKPFLNELQAVGAVEIVNEQGTPTLLVHADPDRAANRTEDA